MKSYIFSIIICLAFHVAVAQTTYTWNGSVSTSPINPSNWTPNGLPLPGDHLVIVTAPRIPTLISNTACTNFTLTSGTIDLGGFMLTASGNAVFTAGTVQNGAITISGATTTTFGNGPVTMNCVTNVTSGSVTVRNTTFQGTTNITKTGASSDAGYGQNTFNGVTTIINNGTGYWLSTNTAADVYNNNVTFTANAGRIIPVQNGTNTRFNGNIIVNCTNVAGTVEIGNNTGTSSLAATSTITVGGSGFAQGVLKLNNLTQAAGGAASSLTLTSGATLQVNTSHFTAPMNFSAPRMNIDFNTWDLATTLTKTGASADNCSGNTFLSSAVLTNSGNSEWIWGVTTPDLFSSSLTVNNSGTSNFRLANSSLNNRYDGPVVLNNNGGGTDNYILVSENASSSAIFNSTVAVNNTSAATSNSLVRFNLYGTCTFRENITLSSTAIGYGIYFGQAGYTGTGTLANSKTINIGTGFSSGGLRFANFTQIGTTPQSLTLTGTALLLITTGTVFNGNVDFSAPRIRLDGATYAGTSFFTKTGGVDDAGSGGNIFSGDATLISSPSCSAYFMTGNGTSDTFNGNLTVTNLGGREMYIGYSHAGQTTSVAGNLTVSNGGPSSEVRFVETNAGILTVAGTSTLTNSGPSQNIVFNTGTGSSTTFTGDVTTDNSGTASRIYMARRGTTALNGNLIVGSSSANPILFGDLAGTTTLAASRTISTTVPGFTSGSLILSRFTQAGGTPQTFVFTGTGLLDIGPTSTFTGPVDFTAAGILIQNSTFNQASAFTKTGASTDNSVGGNTFTGPCTIANSGSGPFRFANTSPDNFAALVTASNSGGSNIELAYNSAGTTFANSVIMSNTSATSTAEISISKSNASSATIAGNLTINLGGTGSSTSNVGYFAYGLGSSLTIAGNLLAANTAVGTGNNDLSFAQQGTLTVNGTASFTNNGGGTNARTFLGESDPVASIIFNNDVTFANNSSPSNDGYIRIVRGTVAFKGNILVNNTSTAPNVNGIYLCWAGAYAGNATLANSKTISLTGTGFTTGVLSLLRFTQIGTTDQSLTLSNTATLVSGPSSSFGANNVSFSSPSIYLDGAVYSGVTSFSKTGANTNSSAGGNTFTGVSTVVNSGSGVMRFANTNPDNFVTHLGATNSGSGSLQLAYNSAGNLFGGNVTLSNTGSGASNIISMAESTNATAAVTGNFTISSTGGGTSNTIYVAHGAGASVTVGGAFTLNNAATGTANNYAYVAYNGSFVAMNDAVITNTSSGANSLIYVAHNIAAASFTCGGNFTLTHAGTANSNECYLANNGAINIIGNTLINNNGSGATSYIRICETAATSTATFNGTFTSGGTSTAVNSLTRVHNGTATFNGNMLLSNSSTASATYNGFYIGSSGNTGNATLASGRTITSTGFASGVLQLYNFTQSGNTAQNLALTGTGRLAIGLASLPSTFNGDLTFTCSGGSAILSGSNFNANVTGSAVGITAVNNVFNGVSGTTLLTNNINTATGLDCGGNTFNAATTLTNNGITGSTWRWGQTAADAFSSTLNLNVLSAGAVSMARTVGTSTFGGNIVINSPSTGTLAFGFNGGNATLNAGNISTVGPATGNIDIRRFTQASTSANSLTLGGAATLTLGTAGGGNIFAGSVTFVGASTATLTSNTFVDLTGTAAGIQILTNTFNGPTQFTKNGTSNDDTNGGNTFNGIATITTSNTGRWRLGSSAGDDVNNTITFIQNGGGLLQPVYSTATTFAGNISTVGSGAAITFGAAAGGRVVIDGNATQTWSGDVARKPLVARLTMQTGGTPLNLAVPMDISVDLTLVTGKINTTATNILLLNDESVTVTNTTVASTSFIDGPMNYTSNTNAANSILFFPLGDGTISRPIALTYSHTNTTAATYTAEDFTGAAGSLGFTKPSTIDRVSGLRYYKVDRTSVANLTNARIRIYYGTDDEVTDYPNLKVVKSTSNTSPWIDIAGTATANGTGSILSSTFTSFSYFALANNVGGTNPLPVELLFFKANVNAEHTIDLSWATATEKNNDYFTIERSTDGNSFETVLTKPGSGTTNERKDYSAVDMRPLGGLSYYRLKQTDYDGKYSYSDVVSARVELEFSLYPNPSPRGEFFIQFPVSENQGPVKVVLNNALGQQVYSQEIRPDKSGLMQFGDNGLKSGIYLLKLEAGNTIFYQRLIVE